MDSSSQEIRILRCRLCFHAGTNYQLIEVFTKSHDLSKRVISALGVKINRSEKHARICTVCETLLDIIQSFQAVCKQTNQLHHNRTDFLLYDTFWDSREQDAVKVTERMVLTHRSEVDKTISGTITIPAGREPELPPVVSAVIEPPVNEVKYEKEPSSEDALKTEIVICAPAIKDEPHDDDSKGQFQPELEEPDQEAGGICDIDTDSDFKPDPEDMAVSESEQEQVEISENSKPKKRGRKPKLKSIDEAESQGKESENERPRRRGRQKRTVDENDQSENEYEPKIPGKRGPRRKKVRKSDPSVCDICGQTVAHFVKESHRNQHLGVRPYKCDFEGCGRSYFSQNDLRTHGKRHQITYHVCEICGRNIKGVEWFRRHVKTHTEGPQFTCEVCGSKFRRKAQLQTHMVTHTGLTPHECEICGKRFALKYNLEAHVKRHQKKEDHAPEKQKEASEKRTWKYYVRAENSGLKHHVTCETCGSSVHKREIEGHVNKHLGRRPYSCDVPGCTLAFYGLRGIKEHKMVVHSDKILRYDCSVCNRSIKGAGTFKRHVMMHNSDMKVECQHCGKKFTSKSYLKAHEQKHSGERPYVCELCGRSFAMKPCWKMHMKTVHNEDHRELTRIRKREPDGSEQQVDPSMPANGVLLMEEPQPSTASSLSLSAQTIDHQQYHSHQQPLSQTQAQQQQPVLQTPVIPSSNPLYPTPDSVRTDYSY